LQEEIFVKSYKLIKGI